VLDVLPLSSLAVLVEVGSRLTTPRDAALARLPLVAPPASAKGHGAHPTIRPRTRHWAGSKVWLLPGGQCLQTFADIDEWHAVASVHRTAPGALPKLQQAFIGDDAAEPFALLFAAGGGQPETPPGEAALAKMLASLRQAETTLGCHLGMRAITVTQAGALQALGLRAVMKSGTVAASSTWPGGTSALLGDTCEILWRVWKTRVQLDKLYDQLTTAPADTVQCATCLDHYRPAVLAKCQGCAKAYCSECLQETVLCGLGEGCTRAPCAYCKRELPVATLAAALPGATVDRLLQARLDKAEALGMQRSRRGFLHDLQGSWTEAVRELLAGPRCPNEACLMRFDSHDACACLECPHCGTHFCAWCFNTHHTSNRLGLHVRRCTAKPAEELLHQSVFPTDAGQVAMAEIWRKRQVARASAACEVAVAAGAEALVWRVLEDLPDSRQELLAKRRKTTDKDGPREARRSGGAL
jgi:hypothetical protein